MCTGFPRYCFLTWLKISTCHAGPTCLLTIHVTLKHYFRYHSFSTNWIMGKTWNSEIRFTFALTKKLVEFKMSCSSLYLALLSIFLLSIFIYISFIYIPIYDHLHFLFERENILKVKEWNSLILVTKQYLGSFFLLFLFLKNECLFWRDFTTYTDAKARKNTVKYCTPKYSRWSLNQ